MMTKHKRQHFIPQSYLSSWLDPNTPENYEPYVWIVNKRNQTVSKRAPKNIFYERDLYTIKDSSGNRDLVLEHGLSQLEGMFVSLARNKIFNHSRLDNEDHFILAAFISAMNARTPARAEESLPFWRETLDKINAMSSWSESATPEQLDHMKKVMMTPMDASEPFITKKDIEEVIESPIPTLMPSEIAVGMELLPKLDMLIIETSTKPGFITSDNPCVWHDPEGYKRPFPFQGPALMYPSIEITLPISPSFMFLLNRMGNKGYLDLSRYGPLVDLQFVNTVNRRIVLRAKDLIIVNQNLILWDWFYDRY